MAKKATVKKPAPVAKTAAPVAEPKVEAVAAAPAPAASAIPPTQQAAIDKVIAEARAATEAILGGKADNLGASPGPVDETQDHAQADHIPGTRRKDKTYVPEWIYDDREAYGSKRKVLDYNRFRYCMIPEDDFSTYTLNGWKFVHFDGGSRSGLLSDGWQGTGDSVFMRDIRGYCRRGDVYLMYTEVKNYLEIVADDEAAAARALKAPIGHFADVAYGNGIRPHAEVNGESML